MVTTGVPGLHTYKRFRYGVPCKKIHTLSLNGRSYCDLFGGKTTSAKGERFKIVNGQRFVKIRSITEAGTKRTVDIEVDHPDHSFETPIGVVSNSEVAFWENTDEIKTGVFQAAEMAEEIILESTANGLGNMFHHMWQAAERGLGRYIAIFIPWYWQEEYRTQPPADFALDKEEAAYAKAYNLYDDQMYWRRLKIVELEDPLLFKQEYPATSAEAFQTTGINTLISAESVLTARKTMGVQKYGAYVVGCDPAREGDDATSFIRRQGRKAWKQESYHKLDDMEKAGKARLILEQEPVDMMFIDRGGGSGMYDRLVEMGFGRRARLINFGGKAMDTDRYKNRRSEMWDGIREWLDSEEEVELPDSDALQADLTAPGFKYTSTTQKQLEPKTDIKKRIGKSPDEGDALALTFAEPVQIQKSGASTRRRRTGMAV